MAFALGLASLLFANLTDNTFFSVLAILFLSYDVSKGIKKLWKRHHSQSGMPNFEASPVFENQFY